MDQETVRGRAGAGRVAAHGLVATALTLSLVPSLAYASPENEEEASSATNTEEASSQSEVATTSSNDYTPVTLSNAVGTAVTNYDLSKIVDGTYQGTAVIGDNGFTIDGNESGVDVDDSWTGYTVTVQVTVANHAITKVEVSSDAPRKSTQYVNDAVDGYEDNGETYKGVPSQIVEGNGTGSVDAVSGATVTSKAIVSAVNNALENAKTEDASATDEYTYGYAALTWAEYWANEGVYNAGSTASSSEQDSHGESDKGAFDVVTRATTNHGLHRGSYQCAAVIQAEDGTEFNLATWAADGKSFTTTDGKTIAWNKGEMTVDGKIYKMKDYEVTGLKYVPVKVKTSDLDAFKQTHAFVANGETLAGGYGESNLKAYSGLVADVDATTHGLKTVTMSGTTASFSAADETGTGSGIKDQELKTADLSAMGPKLRTTTVPEGSRDATVGSYGEFMRLDFTQNYGDLGANMQSVTWTYYGDDSSYTNAKATFGTKFAADNWMHKSMGIQLGLTDSARCELPAGTDGTGYWKVTIRALGYADSSYTFQATSDNIKQAATPVTEETKQKLQELYDKAAALNKDDYTAESWEKSAIETERGEAKDLLAKEDLGESEASEQITHLQTAIDALVKAEKAAPEAGSYILMNIPYSEFYAAETPNNNTSVDVFTSATKNKTRTASLAGGSYHVNADGSDITGITFPVKVSESAAQNLDWSALTKVADSSSVEISVTNRGQSSTTTYTGKDALFESATHSFYQLGSDAAPTNYKELTVDENGNFQFSAVRGAEAKTVEDKDAEFTTESKYGDYELDLSNSLRDGEGAALNGATVYGVVVNTTDGTGYGMRHLENIWRTVELSWCTGFTDAVHGCPTSSEHYKSMMGKTIESITYYTSNGTVIVKTPGEDGKGIYVPVKVSADEASVSANDTSADETDPTVLANVTLPEGFDPAYKIDGNEVTPQQATRSTAASVTLPAEGLSVGRHTLTVSDKAGKYADISTTFVMSTENAVAKYENGAVVAAREGADISAYLKGVTSVSVNGKAYQATGRGAVKVLSVADDSKSATVNAAAVDGQKNKVFNGYGTYKVTVSVTGYPNLTFDYVVEADKTQLNAAIKTATDLRNDNGEYSSASWSALQDAIKAAEDVSKNTEASDDDVVNALNNLNDAQKALQAGPRKNLEFAVSQAASLNESDYTKASWKTFSDALSAAQDALKNQSATESELQQAADNLSKSQDGLAKAATSADRKVLIDEIGTAGTLGKADYTADSWKAYQDALDAAKAAANADDPSAKEIQDATANLAAARQALVENGSGNGSGSDNGGTAGGDTGNNNGNDNGDGNGNASDGDNPSNANDADDSAAGSDAPQTGDNLLGFAGAFAAIAAAAAGVVAAARRRLTGR